jgi:hypothetical protein
VIRRLITRPVFGGDSDSIGQFGGGCGSHRLEGLGDLAEGELSEINQSAFAELEVLSFSGRLCRLGFGDLL